MMLYLITADIFIPFYYQLSKYFESQGYSSCFLTFLYREHLWLKKNQVNLLPDDVFSIHTYPIKSGLLNDAEINDVLTFSMLKGEGSRKVWQERVKHIASYMDDLLERTPFSAVMVWNGEDFIAKTMTILAKRRNIKIIYAENGYFSKTLQFDTRGVNVHSSITTIPFEQLPTSHHKADTKQQFSLAGFKQLASFDFFRCFLTRVLHPDYYRHFPELKGNNWFKLQGLNYQKSRIPQDTFKPPEKFIFIPFQVHDDTQILLNSKHFKDMESFFEFCYKSIRRVFKDKYTIVVKEHPEDFCRKSYEKLQRNYPDVVWLKKCNLDELLDKASFIMVVNSSVGLQAVQRFKPVVIFGESFYSRDDIAFKVHELSNIDRILTLANLGLDEKRRQNIARFIDFLKHDYFVGASWKQVDGAGIHNSGTKILELIKG